MIRRTHAAALAVALTGVLAAAPAPVLAAQSSLPDLGMARLSDLAVATTAGGTKQLRFSATIVNVGVGPFELHASRSDGGPFQVAQWIYQSDGSHSEVEAPVELVLGGDGHGHWHVKDLETYELRRLDNGVKVGTGLKSGFCFFDNREHKLTLAGAPKTAQYTADGCGDEHSQSLLMGLSVGWGDRYPWTLPDQYIDITNLDNGKYRLVATADPLGKFTESATANNTTWVDISLSTRRGQTSVKVLAYGPSS